MNTRKFLTAVWPPGGYYCLAAPWVRPDGKKVYAHRAYETIDNALIYILKNKESCDLYFAPHTLEVARELNPKTGKLQTFRTQANMREARAFFFDIDISEHYPTQIDILGALENFLFYTSLPNPFIVSSGRGVHVYWITDIPIESGAWREPAGQLYQLAVDHDLYVDPARTIDQSSILRVPGTLNLKDPANPRKVVILAEGAVTPTQEFLDRLGAGNNRPGGVAYVTPDNQHVGALAVAWSGRLPPADEVAEVCEHMRRFRDSAGCIPEPQWHVGVGTIKYCDDGPAAVHRWSAGYPGYTHDETQAKIEAWTAPPPGCAKISHNSGDPAICASCRYKTAAKNPVLIANLVYETQACDVTRPAPAQVIEPAERCYIDVTPPCQPAFPYTLDLNLGVRDKDGLICKYPLFPIKWFASTSNESSLSRWLVKQPREGWKEITLLNSDLEPSSLGSAIRDQGIFSTKSTGKLLNYMLSYLHELQKHQDALRQYDWCGWDMATEAENPSSFVLYDRKILTIDGSTVPCSMTKTTQLIKDCMGQAGNLRAQVGLMQIYNRPEYLPQQFILGASLATPWFRLSNHHGMLICLTGETGASKSTGAYFAASLWGHPELYPLSGLRRDGTDKGRYERAAILRNLPFIVDEITLLDPATAREIALSASQPGSWVGLKANRDFRQPRGGFKSNLTICTSNKSLVQIITTDNPAGHAGIMRVFEIKVEKNSVYSKTEVKDIYGQLLQNYGWIGEDSLKKCLPYAEHVSRNFRKILEQFEVDINASPEERFRTAGAATALLGVKLGNKLGYFPFDYQQLREWLIDEQIPAMRKIDAQEQERQSPETVLSEYLAEINPHIYYINENGEPIISRPDVEYKARHDISKSEMFVRIGPFRSYCIRYHHDYNAILSTLESQGFITSKHTKKRMMTGTKISNHPVPCFIVRMPAPANVIPNSAAVAAQAATTISKIIKFQKLKEVT